jgi:hypothetical protein
MKEIKKLSYWLDKNILCLSIVGKEGTVCSYELSGKYVQHIPNLQLQINENVMECSSFVLFVLIFIHSFTLLLPVTVWQDINASSKE